MRTHPYQNRQSAQREDRLLAFAELPQIREHDLHDVRGQLAAEQQQPNDNGRIESEDERLGRLVHEINMVISEFSGRIRDLPDEVARALQEQIPVFMRSSIQTAERNGIAGLNTEEFDHLRNLVAEGIRGLLGSIAGGVDEGKHKAEMEAQQARRKAMNLESVLHQLQQRQVDIVLEERVNVQNLEDVEHPEKVDLELQKFQKREQQLQETQSEITKLGTDIRDFHEKASKEVKELMEPHIAAALGTAAAGAAAGAIICGSWNLGIGAIPGAIIGGIIGYAIARTTAHIALSGAAEAKANEYNEVINKGKQRFIKAQLNAQEMAKKIEEDGKILSAAPASIGKKQKEFYVKRRAEIEVRQKETEEERQTREKNVVEMGVSRQQMEDHLKNLQERHQALKKNREEIEKGGQDLSHQEDQLHSNAGQINAAISDIEEGLHRLPPDHPQAQALRKQLEALQKARGESGHGLHQVQQGQKQMQEAGRDVQGQLMDTQITQINLDQHDRSLAQTIAVLQESIPVLQQHEGILGSNALELQQGLSSQLEVMGRLGNDIGKEAMRANVMNIKSNVEMTAARNSIAGLPPVETPSFVSNVLQGTFEGIGHGIKFVVVDNIAWALDGASKWLKKELPVLGHIISFPIDVVSGVVHGVGEMLEGITTLLAHPEGLGTLFGYDPEHGTWNWPWNSEKACKAWAEMGPALISWKEFSGGEVGKGLGKIVLNVLMTVTGIGSVGVGGSGAKIAFIGARSSGSSITGAVVRAGLVGMRNGLAEFGSGLYNMPGWILKDLPKEALHTIAEIVKSPLSIYKYFKTPRGAALEASIGRDLAAFGEVGTRIEQFTIGGKNIAEIPGLAGRSAQELASMTGAEFIAAGITDASAIREFVHFRRLVQQADSLQMAITTGRHAQELRAIATEAGIADQAAATRVADNLERIVIDARSKDTRYLTRVVDDINREMPLQRGRAYQILETTQDGGIVAFNADGKLVVRGPKEIAKFIEEAQKIGLQTSGKPLLRVLDHADSARILVAESMIGPMSPQQQQAFIKAHYQFGAKTSDRLYTMAELRGKAKTLRAGGFDMSEIDLLMRTGLTGDSAVLERAAAIKHAQIPLAMPPGLSGMTPAEQLRFFVANKGKTVKLKLNTGGERVGFFTLESIAGDEVILKGTDGKYLREPAGRIVGRIDEARTFEAARNVNVNPANSAQAPRMGKLEPSPVRSKPELPKNITPVPALEPTPPPRYANPTGKGKFTIPVEDGKVITVGADELMSRMGVQKGSEVKIWRRHDERWETWTVRGIDAKTGKIQLIDQKGANVLTESADRIVARMRGPDSLPKTPKNRLVPDAPVFSKGDEALIMRSDGSLMRGHVKYTSKDGWHVRGKDRLIKPFDPKKPQDIWHVKDFEKLQVHDLPNLPEYARVKVHIRAREFVAKHQTLSDPSFNKLFPKDAVLQQGQLGDCWLIAALESTQRNVYFPELMKTAIKEIKEGGKIIGWDVRFPLGSTEGSVLRVTAKDIGTGSWMRGRSVLPVNAPDGFRILEAAVAKTEARLSKVQRKQGKVPLYTKNGELNIQQILELGTGNEALEYLFGNGSNQNIIRGDGLRPLAETGQAGRNKVVALFENFTNEKDIVTVQTTMMPASGERKYTKYGHEFYHNHTYSIQSVNRFDRTVTIANPHNTGRRPFILSWDQAVNVFRGFRGVELDALRIFR